MADIAECDVLARGDSTFMLLRSMALNRLDSFLSSRPEPKSGDIIFGLWKNEKRRYEPDPKMNISYLRDATGIKSKDRSTYELQTLIALM